MERERGEDETTKKNINRRKHNDPRHEKVEIHVRITAETSHDTKER